MSEIKEITIGADNHGKGIGNLDLTLHSETNKFSLAKWLLVGLFALLVFFIGCQVYIYANAPDFVDRWESIFSQLVTPIFSLASLVVGYYFGNNAAQK